MPVFIGNDEDYNRINSMIKDISAAKQIQKSLLGVPFENNNISIDSLYIPCKELSGDSYCWFKIDSFRYGVILIDVMGHSIPSALIGMSVRSLLKGMITRLVNPVSVINELNKHMINLYFSNTDTLYYFSTFYMVIDTKTKEIQYVNSGHPPAIALVDNKEIIELKEGSIAIGLMPKMLIEKGKLSYSTNVKILLYTDGVFDALNKSPKESIEYLKYKMEDSCSKSYKNIIYNIFNNNSKDELEDDVCVISISTI